MFVFKPETLAKVDSLIQVDTWKGYQHTRLEPAFWEGSEFSIVTPNVRATLSVNVRVTGRKVRKVANTSGRLGIRIALDILDEETGTNSIPAWLFVDSYDAGTVWVPPEHYEETAK